MITSLGASIVTHQPDRTCHPRPPRAAAHHGPGEVRRRPQLRGAGVDRAGAVHPRRGDRQAVALPDRRGDDRRRAARADLPHRARRGGDAAGDGRPRRQPHLPPVAHLAAGGCGPGALPGGPIAGGSLGDLRRLLLRGGGPAAVQRGGAGTDRGPHACHRGRGRADRQAASAAGRRDRGLPPPRRRRYGAADATPAQGLPGALRPARGQQLLSRLHGPLDRLPALLQPHAVFRFSRVRPALPAPQQPGAGAGGGLSQADPGVSRVRPHLAPAGDRGRGRAGRRDPGGPHRRDHPGRRGAPRAAHRPHRHPDRRAQRPGAHGADRGPVVVRQDDLLQAVGRPTAGRRRPAHRHRAGQLLRGPGADAPGCAGQLQLRGP